MSGLRASVVRLLGALESPFDKHLLAPEVPMSQTVAHDKWQEYLYQLGNKDGLRILEIGSREVTGQSKARTRFSKAEYVGLIITAATMWM